MMPVLQKHKLTMALMLATATLLTACDDDNSDKRVTEKEVESTLTRLATVPAGAEVTGAYITEQGDLFFNVQHPSSENIAVSHDGKVFNTGTVGYLSGVNMNKLPKVLTSSPVPKSDQDRQTVVSAYGQYKVLAQTGDTFAGAIPNGLGNVYDHKNIAPVISIDDPDFNGFIPSNENGTEGYLFTNWESAPGGMSRLKIKKADNEWTVEDGMMIDFGQWGTTGNCFGSVSPWGTPLTSEEWGNAGDETHLWDDRNWAEQDGRHRTIKAYMDPNDEKPNVVPNTYRLHYIVEIADPLTDQPKPIKRYAMGRYEHENSIVMPDEKTVYLSQDNTNGVLFKFVADTAQDLSSGALYGAKLTQDANRHDPATTGFDIEWIKIAHGNDTEIESWIAEYDNVEYHDGGQTHYLLDRDAEAWAQGADLYPDDGGKVTAGKEMDNRIAFLESRKAARALGATAEWRKFEGIYINQKRAKEAVEGVDLIANESVDKAYVYFAIADLDKGMIDEEGDIQLSDRVKDCGGVYRMKLGENYDVNRIEPVVMGSTYRAELSGAERCDVNSLSQPDNLIVMDDGRLVIGEDGFQENNTLWLYNPHANKQN